MVHITNTEKVSCNFCGADNYVVRHIINHFNYVQCKDCGHVYVNPRLTADAINKLYNERYFQGKGFDKSIEYEKEFNERQNVIDLNEWDISTIKEMLSSSADSQKLLDVGCGMGLFLWKAIRHGFEAEGLELSPYAAEFVRSKNITVYNHSIYDAELKNGSYEAVVMKEVIEHLPDPKDAVRRAYNLLKPGGVLFLTTGNYDCPERVLRGEKWFYFMPEGHIHIFSNRTLTNYLHYAGFKDVKVTNQGDLLLNFLLRNKIIEPERFEPNNYLKKIIFKTVRFINRFISSGIRAYAVK